MSLWPAPKGGFSLRVIYTLMLRSVSWLFQRELLSNNLQYNICRYFCCLSHHGGCNWGPAVLITLRVQDSGKINGTTAQKHVTVFSWFPCWNIPLTLIRSANLKNPQAVFKLKEQVASHGVARAAGAEEVGTKKNVSVIVTWDFEFLANEASNPEKPCWGSKMMANGFCFWDENSVITPECFQGPSF